MAEATRTQEFDTTVGVARAHFFDVNFGVPRATAVMGHGAGAGIGTWDLQLLAGTLPGKGIDVVLIEQPWVLQGKKVASSAKQLDAAFREVTTKLRRSGEGLRRLVVGGRSAGARVACRVAADVTADAVLCLAYPLHRPGRSQPNRAHEIQAASRGRPVTVLQGERDGFGGPVEVATAVAHEAGAVTVVSVPWSDHSFKVPKKAPVTPEETGAVLVSVAERALLGTPGNAEPLLSR